MEEWHVTPNTSLEDFTALVRRAGLPMTDQQIADLHGGSWLYVERMVARVRGDGVDRALEPAHVFSPEQQ